MPIPAFNPYVLPSQTNRTLRPVVQSSTHAGPECSIIHQSGSHTNSMELADLGHDDWDGHGEDGYDDDEGVDGMQVRRC